MLRQARRLRAAAMTAGAMLAAGALPAIGADTYPAKPVRLIVGFSAGGANDLVARVVAAKLGPRLGGQVIVDNRPGAGGVVSADMVARAAPDGYTVLLAAVSSIAMGPALRPVKYDPIKDLAPVSQAVSVGALLAVHPSLPVRNLGQMVALARQRPGAVDIGFPGSGSVAHLAAEVFKKTAGVDFLLVPYKGGAPALADVMGGQIGSMMSLISTPAPHVKSGKLRGIAVSTAKRSPALPDVPTIAESGYPGYDVNGWLGFSVPAGTPQPIISRMHKEIVAIMAMPDVRERLETVGMIVDPSASPAEFASLIRADVAKWTREVDELKLGKR